MTAILTPEDLKKYSSFKKVQTRSDDHLKTDILEATLEINYRIGKDIREMDPVPDEIDLALKKLAEYYALINQSESLAKGYKSEKLSDYSYTLAEDAAMRKPDISSLLDQFIDASKSDNQVKFRMRTV